MLREIYHKASATENKNKNYWDASLSEEQILSLKQLRINNEPKKNHSASIQEDNF